MIGLIDDQSVLEIFSDALIEQIAYNDRREAELSISCARYIPSEEVRRCRDQQPADPDAMPQRAQKLFLIRTFFCPYEKGSDDRG